MIHVIADLSDDLRHLNDRLEAVREEIERLAKADAGGKTVLGRISKRGNTYLRRLFIRGARVAPLRPEKQDNPTEVCEIDRGMEQPSAGAFEIW